ncbi:MAG: DUF308 domain-containing protein [Anaerovorax sp.]
MRIFTIVTGIILALTGVWCFANPGTTFLAMAFILGIVMIFSGGSEIFTYVFMKKKRSTPSWIIGEAIISILLGIIVLSNQLATDVMVPVFFGLWIMFSGVMRITGAVALKGQVHNKGWLWTLILGMVGTVVGVYCSYNPIAANFAIVLLVGVTFMLQGINICSMGIQMPHKIHKGHKEKVEKAAE